MTAIRARRRRAVLAVVAALTMLMSAVGGPGASAKAKKATKRKVTATTAKPKKATTTSAAPALQPGPAAEGRKLPPHPEQGITAKVVKIGIAMPNPVSATADYRVDYNAMFAKYRDEGRIPVNGRDIQPVYFQLTNGNSVADNAASQRQACVQLATRDKVAIAVGQSNVTIVGTCMSAEFHVPFIGSAGATVSDEDMATGYPFLFWDNQTGSRTLRNWPYWAKDYGFLGAGSKLGSLIPDDPVAITQFEKYFKPQLAKLGYKLSAEALYKDASSIPGAVQRFKAAGIDVIFDGAGAAFIALGQELDKQKYIPDVLVTDWDTQATTASIPRDLPDNFRASAMTAAHKSEDGQVGNLPEPKQTTECMDTLAKYGGKRLIAYSGGRPTADYAEYQQVMHICDHVEILVTALERAGKNLTTESLIAALEQTKNVDHGTVAGITWSANKHDGNSSYKTLTWDYGCDCWKHQAGFKPNYVD